MPKLTILEKRQRRLRRILAAVREIGILLIALAPLDAVLAKDEQFGTLAKFGVLGVALFVGALIVEWNRLPDGGDNDD